MRIGIEGLPLLFHRTGTSTYTHELVQSLRRLNRGDQVILFARDQRMAGDSYHNISFAERAANYIYKEYRLPQELAERGIDIYHAPRDMGLPKTSRLPCASIITLHDIILIRLASDYYSAARARMYERRLRDRVGGADHVITISEFSRKDILDWCDIDPGKISVVHDAVNETFRPVTDEAKLAAVGSRYQLPPRFALCVGSTEPRKNIRNSIKAFTQLRRVRADVQLVVTGVEYCRVGPDQAFAGLDLEGVHFAGYVHDQDMPAIYSMAEVLVFPSLYEGFGLPPLESMACGTPVVTSNSTSIPEIVGDAAVLVDPESPAEIAGALEMVLSSGDVRAGLIEKGTARVATFSWRQCAEETRDLYQRVLSARGH
ncbi:MAG: glycosyltransferase family 1 protein [Thermoleophilia bacterium]|nr:glycosyltransferase family 1 protein [Thermoleophilia bacterium]